MRAARSRNTLSTPFAAALAASLLLVAPSGLALDAPARVAAAAPSGPEAISADQIPAAASSARVALASIRAGLVPTEVVEDSALASISAQIDRLRQHSHFSRLGKLPEFRIAELQRQVRFYRGELQRLESRDIALATRLSANAAELGQLRTTWTLTLESGQRQGLSRPLIEEAVHVLEQIEATETLLDQPLADALAGRSRAGPYEARLETLSRRLAEAATQAKGRRLERDVEPIWSVGALVTSPERGLAAVEARIDDQLQFSRHYFEARRGQIEAFGIASGLSFLAVLWLRRRTTWLAAAVEQQPGAVNRVLQRPFSSLMLVLLVLALLGSGQAPTIVFESIAVLGILVLLRVFPKRIVAGNFPLLLGLATLFLLDRARAIMPFDSLAFRLDQLLVAAGLLAGYLHLQWLKRQESAPLPPWIGLIARIAPLGILLLVAAVVLNLIGNISLADLLIRGTLLSTFFSAILFAAAFIVEDFVAMIVRSRAGQHLRMVALHGSHIERMAARLARLAALSLWVLATLAVFHLWEPIAAKLGNLLATSWNLGQLSFTIGGIMTFVIGVLLAVYASRAVRFLLNEEILTRLSWPVGAKSTTATLGYYSVLFGGLLLALSAAGIQTSQFALVVGALSLGIGFGLQTVVNNFVSGLILMFERPIQPGDIIDVDTLQGRVVEIGLRATRVRTWDGAEVVVPNGTLLSGNLINWTLSDASRRVEVAVGVAYGTDLRRVRDILSRVACAQPAAMKDPEPLVLFNAFGASSLDFVVRFWTRDAATAAIARSDAGVAISEALAAEGIQIPFPQQDLHLRSVTPEAAAALKTAEGSGPREGDSPQQDQSPPRA